MRFRTILIMILIIAVAFITGYLWGYIQLRSAEKEWAATQSEMLSKIGVMEKELAQVKTREMLREIPETLSEVMTHFSDKNFGLAIKTLDGIKENFQKIHSSLNDEMRKKFDFFLPALEDLKKEAENTDQNALKRTEEVKRLFEQMLKPAQKE
jgi:hypothetical protein